MTKNTNPAGNPVVSNLVNATMDPVDVVVVPTSTGNNEFERFEALAATLVGIPKAELNS